MDKSKILRLIDANINRAREGLRVVEDIMRFCYDDKRISSKLKSLRHLLSKSFDSEFLLEYRDSGDDVGRVPSYDRASKKATLKGVILANILRAQESSRVLEELAKMAGKDSSKFKSIRFKLYDLQKTVFKKIK